MTDHLLLLKQIRKENEEAQKEDKLEFGAWDLKTNKPLEQPMQFSQMRDTKTGVIYMLLQNAMKIVPLVPYRISSASAKFTQMVVFPALSGRIDTSKNIRVDRGDYIHIFEICKDQLGVHSLSMYTRYPKAVAPPCLLISN